MRKNLCALLALLILFSLTACSDESREVPVERADMLSRASTAADCYAGMVVSENVTKITRDTSKTIQELYVTVGQEVSAGQKLFSYDSEALKLEQSKQELELEKMKNEKSTYTSQLTDLEKQLKKTSDESLKVQLNLQINTIKNDRMQLEYDIIAKEQEIKQIKETLKNVVVTSPVDGNIRKIDENDTDGTYITIQKAGAYRVKGTLNELSVLGGISVGTEVRIISRIDENQTWNGVVSEIDTENYEDSSSGGDDWMYGTVNTMTTTSSYPFYVELEDTEGLLLGQHVYIQVVSGGETGGALIIPQYYLVNLTTDEETLAVTASVWVANSQDKLELREVSVGAYNDALGGYEILSGLSGEDFVADPTAPGCAAGAAVRYQQPSDFTGNTDATGEADPTDGEDPTDEVDTLGEAEPAVEVGE